MLFLMKTKYKTNKSYNIDGRVRSLNNFDPIQSNPIP